VLPYTAEVYFALLERYLAALGPVAAAAELLIVAALAAIALRPLPGQDRAIAGLLAAGWLVTGLVFHGLYFGRLNFLAPVYATLFTVQGVLLVWHGVVRGRLAFRYRGDQAARAGTFLALVALAYPLLDGLFHPDWLGLRLAGLAPAPTVVLTLGLLLLAEAPPRHLLIIPGLWSLVAAFTAWHLAVPLDLGLPLLAAGTAWLVGMPPRKGAAH
jgi:hypothetical protein